MNLNLNLKRISLIGAVVVSAILTWAVAHRWLDDPTRFTGIITMLWPALAFVVSSAVTAVAFMLLEHKADRIAAITASWATFILFWSPDIWYVSALPIFAAFWWFASREIQHDLHDRHTIRASRTLERGMKLILLGLFLMVSLGFYLLPSSQKLNVSTISKGVQSSFQSAYGNPIVEQQLSQLPAGTQAQFQREVGRSIDQTVRAWLSPIKQFVPPILAFGLFLILWSVNIFIRYPAVWLATGLFQLLEAVGFVRKEKGQVETQVLKI